MFNINDNKSIKLEFDTFETLIEKYNILNENGDKIGHIRYQINRKDMCIFIHNIMLDREQRFKGYGTLVVNELTSQFKGYYFIGDICYPGAWNFWKHFDKKLLNCTGYEPELWFEFKSE